MYHFEQPHLSTAVTCASLCTGSDDDATCPGAPSPSTESASLHVLKQPSKISPCLMVLHRSSVTSCLATMWLFIKASVAVTSFGNSVFCRFSHSFFNVWPMLLVFAENFSMACKKWKLGNLIPKFSTEFATASYLWPRFIDLPYLPFSKTRGGCLIIRGGALIAADMVFMNSVLQLLPIQYSAKKWNYFTQNNLPKRNGMGQGEFIVSCRNSPLSVISTHSGHTRCSRPGLASTGRPPHVHVTLQVNCTLAPEKCALINYYNHLNIMHIITVRQTRNNEKFHSEYVTVHLGIPQTYFSKWVRLRHLKERKPAYHKSLNEGPSPYLFQACQNSGPLSRLRLFSRFISAALRSFQTSRKPGAHSRQALSQGLALIQGFTVFEKDWWPTPHYSWAL